MIELGFYKNGILYCATNLKQNPHDPVLLYYQAKAMLMQNLSNYALIISKYACEFMPESISAWILLANCYIDLKNYKHVFLM